MAGSPRCAGSQGAHPWDLGLHDNAAAVCGDGAACWLLPGRPGAQGDGLGFPSRWGTAGGRAGGGAGAGT